MNDNNKAFEDAYNDKKKNLYDYVRKMVENPVDAEDIVQETFAWTIGKLKNEPSLTKDTVVGTVFKYCKFIVYNFLYKNRRKNEVAEIISAELKDELFIDETQYRADNYPLISSYLKSMKNLNPNQRNILNDYYMEGMSVMELKEKYGMTDDQIQGHRRQGLAMLKRFGVKKYAKNSGKKSDDGLMPVILKMIEDGYPVSAISERTGLSVGAIFTRRGRYLKSITSQTP